MREELLSWIRSYPRAPAWRDGTFAGAAAAEIVNKEVPNAVRQALGEIAARFIVQGSAGKGDWTHTPWVAILDPAETSTVEEGIYVVYLLSHGCDRLYLSLNQGCTTLKEQAGIPTARAELARRAAVMRARMRAVRLSNQAMDLNTDSWRADLYEHGHVLSKVYTEDSMASENELRLDLEEALTLYHIALNEGGWVADDEIMASAAREIGPASLDQAKRYRQHRQIERNPWHSKRVKQIQGSVCKGCDRDPAAIYGEVAEGVVDAHHLRPLSSLRDGEMVSFDPLKDFAVLCPTCHRVIHRLEDVGDLELLRRLIRARLPMT